MNLENPDLLKYFQQWAVWWIEYANLDGLRVDTYPYIEKQPGAEWLAAIRKEYPDINIVGECWTRPAPAVAYWQSGTKNFDGFDSNLPTVMDFPTEEAIRQALENDGNYWGGGLTKVYDALTMDYMYADVNKLFTFLGNHEPHPRCGQGQRYSPCQTGLRPSRYHAWYPAGALRRRICHDLGEQRESEQPF